MGIDLGRLHQEKWIYPLVSFRIVFGVLMMMSTARFVALDWVADHYVNPVFHFKYFGFAWIAPLPLWSMYMVHGLLFISALAVCLGYRYRIFACLLFISFTYCELIDLTYYLNHYYFVSLVSFLMIWLPAHRSCSLDVKSGRVSAVDKVSAWTIYSIMLMIGIVYFYAGIAKINSTWLLEALPLKIWLPAHDTIPIIGPLFKLEATAYAFSWLGMIFDTTIIFFLWYRKTRIVAFLAVVFFHCMTGYLFQIGVFPVVMICSVSIFFSTEFHRRLLIWICAKVDRYHIPYLEDGTGLTYELSTNRKNIATTFFCLFFGIQLLFPFRYLLYPGSLFWTEEGYRFSWRVMLMEKSGTATFYVRDGDHGREGQVINNDFLNAHQEKQMAFQPDMIIQYAHFLADHYGEQGMANPQVRVEALVTLNGRPSQLFIDPELNLVDVDDSWAHKDWILPLEK